MSPSGKTRTIKIQQYRMYGMYIVLSTADVTTLSRISLDQIVKRFSVFDVVTGFVRVPFLNDYDYS